ncbi:histidine phosphatase family protein [Actinopolymorpha sp. B11F2]|uniref:histidine phosphatase family protein n=1 Tax=Actinopolymorpha sp. B11F2 TaxID=3160862 RepID=UPI0032E4B373
MKNIYVVTHPEATHHVDGLVGGWFDSNLTERGMRQAESIAEALSERLGDADVETITSDLRRAQRTAEVIVKRIGGALKLDPDLREKSYGEAGGRPKAWLEERRIPIPEFGERLRHDEGVDGAETRMDLAVRAYAAMGRIQQSTMENQVVVTHGGTATLLLAAWIGMPLEASGRVQFRVSSGGITHLRKDDRSYSHQIAQLNETSHLN